ncbi:hypothetical protein OsI_34688 [Oryza sativa Indica Group]|uniref:K Homology domain-containing protein n=1 Tax=Oryza sativa subsp. indica TaxID=39946 RepID=B8BIA8_ORYSI|nr:hypothetical protein OsI_34688 [Oryza sativa Indica Group]
MSKKKAPTSIPCELPLALDPSVSARPSDRPVASQSSARPPFPAASAAAAAPAAAPAVRSLVANSSGMDTRFDEDERTTAATRRRQSPSPSFAPSTSKATAVGLTRYGAVKSWGPRRELETGETSRCMEVLLLENPIDATKPSPLHVDEDKQGEVIGGTQQNAPESCVTERARLNLKSRSSAVGQSAGSPLKERKRENEGGYEADDIPEEGFVLEPTGHGNGKQFRLPHSLYDVLHTYQKEGIKWLWTLHLKKLGGALCDEMGMGKTRQEFYALMNFCCPNLLGESGQFHENFSMPIERARYRGASAQLIKESIEASERLKKLVSPFVLRRTKEMLKNSASKLGTKHELTVWLKISAAQEYLYTNLIMSNVLGDEPGTPLAASQVARSICNHPVMVIGSDFEQRGESEEKKDALTDIIRKGLLARALSTIVDPSKMIRMDGKTPQKQRPMLIQTRRVLSMPPEGFGVSKTLIELLAIHGGAFDPSLDESEIRQVRGHESVVGVSNHLHLFSQRESDPVTNEKHKYTAGPSRKRSELSMPVDAEILKSIRSTFIEIPIQQVGCFVGEKGGNIMKLENISGAKIHRLGVDSYTHMQLYKISGTPHQISKAENLVKEFLQEMDSMVEEEISVPMEKNLHPRSESGTTGRFVIRGSQNQAIRWGWKAFYSDLHVCLGDVAFYSRYCRNVLRQILR